MINYNTIIDLNVRKFIIFYNEECLSIKYIEYKVQKI